MVPRLAVPKFGHHGQVDMRHGMRHSLRDHATVALTLRHCKDIARTTAAGWHAISL